VPLLRFLVSWTSTPVVQPEYPIVIGAPFSHSAAPDRVLEMLVNAGVIAATDGTAGELARTLARPAFIALAIRELGRAVSRNLLLLAQAQRFDEKPAAVRELMALDELLRLARARRGP
jgi:hypothetical protein